MGSRGGNSGGVVASQSIPAGSRRIVQSLKEIVNCPETEIYAMLKECNMDPNEAVNRLLSQDPFHEVRSKRDKKKENKDTIESRSRGVSSIFRGSKSGTDRHAGHSGSMQFGSIESGALYAKSMPRKENGTNFPTNSSSASGVAGKNMDHQISSLSEYATMDSWGSSQGVVEGVASISQAPVYQSAWTGTTRQVSMADIVKMGRPHSKSSFAPDSSHNLSNQHVQGPSTSYQGFHSSGDNGSKISGVNPEQEVVPLQDLSTEDGWLMIEQPPSENVPSVLGPSGDLDLHADSSDFLQDRMDSHLQSQIDDVQVDEESAADDISVNHVGSASVSGRKLLENSLEVDVGVSLSPVTSNIQRLSIQKEDQGVLSEDNGPSLVIPDHLQVQTADCSHLSFGSFGCGISASFSGSGSGSGPSLLRPQKTNMEGNTTDTVAFGHLDVRNSDYYGDDSLRKAPAGSLTHRIDVNHVDYDSASASASQPDVLKQENVQTIRGNQYSFSTSSGAYSFSQPETNSQMQNLAPFSSAMPTYTTSLPSSLMASNLLPLGENDLTLSSFPLAQSMSTKYGNPMSSISTTTNSMSEAFNAIGYSSNLSVPQTHPGTSVNIGQPLPQHLPVHPYSQPSPLGGHYTNMIGYPMLPQGYTYMPSAFQQAFASNSSYPQSLAARIPQYKNSVSVSSLPQSGSIASGYGAFGSSTSISGNFSMNPSAAAAGTNFSYDDMMSSQHKDSNHLLSLQQNENSGSWLHGAASRTMPSIPSSAYYGFQGQNQQPGVFRQGQSYGLSYPNLYHSRSGISLEHQQQNLRDDRSLTSTQGQPKPSHHVWQNGF